MELETTEGEIKKAPGLGRLGGYLPKPKGHPSGPGKSRSLRQCLVITQRLRFRRFAASCGREGHLQAPCHKLNPGACTGLTEVGSRRCLSTYDFSFRVLAFIARLFRTRAAHAPCPSAHQTSHGLWAKCSWRLDAGSAACVCSGATHFNKRRDASRRGPPTRNSSRPCLRRAVRLSTEQLSPSRLTINPSPSRQHCGTRPPTATRPF